MASATVTKSEGIMAEERHSGLWLTLNRPDRRNALGLAEYMSLIAALRAAGERTDIRYVALSGSGDHFCSGGDLGGLGPILSLTPAERAEKSRGDHEATAAALMWAIWDLPQPLIVAARGHAIGQGAQLILAADVAIVSETLRFSVPQVRLGHTADHGESWYLPRRVGMTQAARLLLTGESVGGARAVDMGVASELVEDAKLTARLEELALVFANGSGPAQRENKRLLRDSWGGDIFEQCKREREALARSVQTGDFLEAIAAFQEKRPPVFGAQ